MDDVKVSTATTTFDNLLALGQIEAISKGERTGDVKIVGHKFGLPSLPLPPTANLKYRYDPVVDQVTNLIMRHGKKGVAQRVSFLTIHPQFDHVSVSYVMSYH